MQQNQYLNNSDEPAETISEMSPSQVELTGPMAKNITRQRYGLRKIALKLRLIKQAKAD